MQTIAEIVEAARRLSDDDRRRLVEALQDRRQEPIEQRRDAMSSWLSLAGIFHSAFTDVSTEKYKHLADVYSDER
jgi:DNA-binding GntR family transcriptional regulator